MSTLFISNWCVLCRRRNRTLWSVAELCLWLISGRNKFKKSARILREIARNMKLYFENLERFEQKFSDYYPFDKCPKCHRNFEIQLSTATIRIEHKKLIVHDCPIQVCQKCHNELIGHRVPMFIYKAYTEFEQHPNTTVCDVTLKGNARFDYAESANFIYDSRDLNIPGCDVDEYPTHTEGFSLPVYFDRKVLNNFYTDDDYELDFFSGCIPSISSAIL